MKKVSSEGKYFSRSFHPRYVLTQQSILFSSHPTAILPLACYSTHSSQAPSHKMLGNQPFYLSASESTQYQYQLKVYFETEKGELFRANQHAKREANKRANSQANSADTSNTA